MGRANNIGRVHESKSPDGIEGRELDLVEGEFTLRSKVIVPMYPDKIHPNETVRFNCDRKPTGIGNVGVVNAQDPPVEVWVCGKPCLLRVLGVQKHDVTLRGIDVNDVLVPSNIVGCKVRSKDLVAIYSVALKDDVHPRIGDV